MADHEQDRDVSDVDAATLRRAFALLDSYVADGAVPGAAAVVTRHGRPAGAHYTGLADPAGRHPVREDTVFSVASLTKPVTAAAVLVLVERGLCGLDEPISRFVPETRAIAGSERITIRHLLTHTSGLPGFAPDDPALRAAQAPLNAFLAAHLRCPLGFTPGTAFRYSNAGVHLQAALIAHLTSQDYHEAVTDLVLRPLGLHDSFLPVPSDLAPRIAIVADPSYAGTPHEQFNSPYHRALGIPWGGLYATAEDVSHFLAYFLSAWSGTDAQPPSTTGGPLSRAARRVMTSVQAAVPPAPPHPHDDVNVQERAVVAWGLGWEIKGAACAHHTGDLTSARTFSHLGASGAMMWADPDSGLGCVLLANRALSSGWATAPARHARFSNAVAAALID